MIVETDMTHFEDACFRSCSDEAGFTLIETLVALAIIAMSLTAIGSLMASNIRGVSALDQRLLLAATTRAILTGLPDGKQIEPGTASGTVSEHRWRLDVRPFASAFLDPRASSPWVPQSVILTVQSPGGRVLQIDTVRLQRRPGS